MHLDDRLQALADFVPEGARAADIGTDHGYLAVALLQQGKANFVVAGDKNRGPYEAAKRTVHEYAISEEQISVRLGDGLEVVKPGEVDTVCIAGMGGRNLENGSMTMNGISWTKISSLMMDAFTKSSRPRRAAARNHQGLTCWSAPNFGKRNRHS